MILASSLFYYVVQGESPFITSQMLSLFEFAAYFYYTIFITGIAFLVVGVWRFLREEGRRLKSDTILIRWRPLVAHVLSIEKYIKVFVASSVAYGLFYSFITSMIVYQPALNFSDTYAVLIPSVRMILGCGSPGQIPILVTYLTEHVGLLLVPLSMLLLAVVSLLVGLNVALTTFAYGSRPRAGRGEWRLGFGAVVGLFTGCPTCTGLFLASMIGGVGAATTATWLAFYQPIFIGVSVPILALTPLLLARNMSKVFSQGCVVREAVN